MIGGKLLDPVELTLVPYVVLVLVVVLLVVFVFVVLVFEVVFLFVELVEDVLPELLLVLAEELFVFDWFEPVLEFVAP